MQYVSISFFGQTANSSDAVNENRIIVQCEIIRMQVTVIQSRKYKEAHNIKLNLVIT